MDNSIITELNERRVDELLAYTPDYSDQNAENIRKLFMHKTARKHKAGRRLLLAAAIAAVAVALSGIALAATGYDFSSIFDSIFSNRKAAPYIRTGDGITVVSNAGDVSVEPLAAFYEPARCGLYIKLRIDDLAEAGVLSDSLFFLNSGIDVNTGRVIVDFIDANTITASLFISPVMNAESTVRFNTIASGITGYYEAQLTGFNIGEHIGIESSVIVQGAEFVEITGITLDRGMLMIEFHDSDPSVYGWGSAFLGVMSPDGETIWGDGISTNTMTGERCAYIEIGKANPDDLTLVWNGQRADHTITGNWEFTISGGNLLETRWLDGEFEGNSIRVLLGATLVEFQISADYLGDNDEFPLTNSFPYDPMASEAATILLADGTTVYPRFSASMLDSMTASFSYEMGFVNPVDIVSVTFCGTTISG